MMMPSLRSSVAVALVGIPTAMAKETRKTSLEEDGTSANSTYDVTGDSASALKQLKGDSSEDEYNRLLLSNLQNKSAKDLIQKLENWESKDQKNHRQAPAPSARKRKRNDWILTYNRALAMHASGDSKGSVEVCLEKLKPVILDYQKVPDEMLVVSCRMVFLLLEGIMALSVGSHAGIEKVDDLVSTDSVINWLDTLNFDKDPELKFLAALYRSRLGFTERDSAGKLLDANIRSSRKELKQAMEIFQHKLRPSGDTVSLGSASCSEEKSTQQQLSMSRILQGQNQAALSLKANAEQLKGNVKKSLILCGEAHTAVSSEDDSSYAAIHANNLSIVFETNGKRHLALHTIAKALRANPSTAGFARDGTARPNLTIKLLYNSATCAAQAQNFLSAYECMATCVQQSAAMSQRPRCWLRLVEACIGIYSKRKKEANGNKISRIEVDGEPKAILVQNGLHASAEGERIPDEELAEELAGEKDLEQVKNNALPRARACLETVLHLFDETNEVDALGFASARLSMSYVALEYHDFPKALEYAKLVIDGTIDKEPLDLVSQKMIQRQQATARMYASEASCAVGDAMVAMRFLVGDGKDDAFDRLASELGGVTIETAATNGQGKSRLARAQAMVRCSASAASASLGNMEAAKQLAMSAQAMEDAYSPSRERSSARRALVYCMLREGNCGGALTLLRSVR